MTYKKVITKPAAPELTDDEMLQQSNFLQDNGYIARVAIAEYVENDEPIPNELKAILYNILQIDYKGKPKDETNASNLNLVKEVIFLIRLENMQVCEAINQVAINHNRDVSSLKRMYESSEFKDLKLDMLTVK